MSAVVTFIFRYVFCVVCAMMIHDSKIVPIKKAISVGIGLQVVSAMVRWRRGEGGVYTRRREEREGPRERERQREEKTCMRGTERERKTERRGVHV
jgi:hypothetical protein